MTEFVQLMHLVQSYGGITKFLHNFNPNTTRRVPVNAKLTVEMEGRVSSELEGRIIPL